ncbi:hypothetical protein Nepgr_028600 [Nepenthes gracilis]|uniref:VQ domain-containing protein n=1 Tax=Nepenthes gracilis TaxID=150966 RepID=A0AAD3Y296_NEPGR|nr:hypothetical protein Nepgr_028600 [Nepenthes gracilis]
MESKKRPSENLGVNKMGKNIRKSPLHQPNFVSSSNTNATTRLQPYSQIYNIHKNDFRTIVQQLTGSPSHEPLPRPPPNNAPKPSSMRLQKIRPPPLIPIHRPSLRPMPSQGPVPFSAQAMAMAPTQVPHRNNFAVPPSQFSQPSPRAMQPLMPTDSAWMNPSLSPTSVYMQQFQSCINDAGHRPMTSIPSQVRGQVPAQMPSSGLLPNPPTQPWPSMRINSPAVLPSPISPFPLPSPSDFLHLLSPLPMSPYPLFSPRNQFPPPLTPTSQSGISGPGLLSPLSPAIAFPLSPSGFFALSSPR